MRWKDQQRADLIARIEREGSFGERVWLPLLRRVHRRALLRQAKLALAKADPFDLRRPLTDVEAVVLAQCLDRPLRLGETQFAAARELAALDLVSWGVAGGQRTIVATDRGRRVMAARRADERRGRAA